ncbi:YlbE-like family protein [Bacillaceae bacterium Marseille-Q3522]|nr:YlbE-like family protein [Bacillaceae bacterium Marseille-Q3522]
MRKELYDYMNREKELIQFIREQPHWYRKLSRNPQNISLIEIAALQYYKKTIPDQVAKLTNGVQMASMMISLFQAMNQKTE